MSKKLRVSPDGRIDYVDREEPATDKHIPNDAATLLSAVLEGREVYGTAYFSVRRLSKVLRRCRH